MLLLLTIIKCWMLSFIMCVWFSFLFLIFYILYKKKSFYTLPCCGQQAMGLLSTFPCASLRFLCRICFFSGGNKVTVNFKYWLKPYTLHMLCFASLMYTNVLIMNQKRKKRKKNLVPYEVLWFHSLCVQVLLDLQSWLTVLLLVSLCLKCHFCHALVKRKKNAHIMVFYCEKTS